MVEQLHYMVRYYNPAQLDWRIGKQTKREKQGRAAFRELADRVGSETVQNVEMTEIVVGSGNQFRVIGKAGTPPH